MTVNQAQVDQILSAASADDPEVKLANLEREVDLIKSSIKKLLIDIRERMNEMENPFVFAAHGLAPAPAMEAADAEEEIEEEEEEEAVETKPKKQKKPDLAADLAGLQADSEMLAALQAQMAAAQPLPPEHPKQSKLRLQKVHRLFEWTGKAVRKYGLDRLEIMLDSYSSMGYLEGDEIAQVKEIARLMPPSLGEADEIKAEEFVSELYVLNRILDPNDTTLDRDMIQVLMDNKRAGVEAAREEHTDKESSEDWIQSLERI
ncbi:hypothetical protein E2N92_12840 [Methanofollis formosanus]|uniref:Archaeal flagella protein FlaD/E domain-containing protein n=1 Tax=Methanofollis formosanus TaxID=299308 RepID=A0A8G1A2N4_9EURY|nr:hypothetical protein [Methanofollis formosanus]QYZ80254.1 hypothetical protein E2N92_12840 [Methanofollis formosanus]